MSPQIANLRFQISDFKSQRCEVPNSKLLSSNFDFSQDETARNTAEAENSAPRVGTDASADAPTHHVEAQNQADNQTDKIIHPGDSPFPQFPPVESSTTRLNYDQLLVATQRKNVVLDYRELIAKGARPKQACKQLGVPRVTLWRWDRAYTAKGLVGLKNNNEKSGRRPDYLPSAEELQCVRAIYIKLNDSRVRGKGLGSSKVTAYRLAAKSNDPRITEKFRAVVLQQRKQKAVPPSWERLLDTPASVLAHVRDHSSTLTKYISTPRGLDYIDANGNAKPLMPGTIFESDDGTLNFPIVVPWPYGGDKCSEKFGVKVGRFQLLPIVDRRTRFCPLFHLVIRSKSSYRGEDIVALFGSTFSEIGMPEAICLERGSWESEIVNAALALTPIKRLQAWQPKQKDAVENFFDRLWTPLSLLPGHVGRSRGDNRENTKLLMACEDGRQDPRKHFMTVEQAMTGISNAVAFVNSEPVQSKHFGTWIPQQMWEQHFGSPYGVPPLGGRDDRAASSAFSSPSLRPSEERAGERSTTIPHSHFHSHSPLQRLDPSLKIFFSRETRSWTVRGNCVGGKVETPTLKFPIYFQTTELWEFEGCKIKCYFDPFTDPCLGTLVLESDWRSYKSGHIIARDVPALDLPPQAVLAADWDNVEYQRSLAVRKAMSKAVRTEAWSWLGNRTSEARDGLGNLTRLTLGTPRTGRSGSTASQTSSPSLRQSEERAGERSPTLLPPVPNPGAHEPTSQGNAQAHTHSASIGTGARFTPRARGPFAPVNPDPTVTNRLKNVRAKLASVARQQLTETETRNP